MQTRMFQTCSTYGQRTTAKKQEKMVPGEGCLPTPKVASMGQGTSSRYGGKLCAVLPTHHTSIPPSRGEKEARQSQTK